MAETHAPAPGKGDDGEGSSGGRSWQELSSEEQNKLLKARLKKYCQKVSMLNGRLHQSWLVELLSCSAGVLMLGKNPVDSCLLIIIVSSRMHCAADSHHHAPTDGLYNVRCRCTKEY